MEYLTREELKRLFQEAYKANRQHHLCLVTSLFHGLRISETLAITGKDIKDGQLSVQRMKGSNATIQRVHRDDDPLFDGTPILELAKQVGPNRLFPFSRQRVDYFIKRYAERANVHHDKAHSHAVGKHSLGMLIWEQTHDLSAIQNFLGHKRPGSSLFYLAEVDKSKAQAAVDELRFTA
jgi:integrase